MFENVNKKAVILGVVAVSLLAVGFTGFNKGKVIAKVGRVKVYQSQYDDLYKRFPAETQKQLDTEDGKKRLMDQLVNEALLINQAKTLGLHKDPEYTTRVEDAEKQLLLKLLVDKEINQDVSITNQDIQAFYDQNPAAFAAIQQRRCSHILVATQAEADKAYQRVMAGEAFDKVASDLSIDASKGNGGDIGWYRKGQIAQKAFEDKLFILRPVGSVSRPTKTDLGYHVIKLTGITNTPNLTVEQARNQIINVLRNQKQQAALNTYMAKLKETVDVTTY